MQALEAFYSHQSKRKTAVIENSLPENANPLKMWVTSLFTLVKPGVNPIYLSNSAQPGKILFKRRESQRLRDFTHSTVVFAARLDLVRFITRIIFVNPKQQQVGDAGVMETRPLFASHSDWLFAKTLNA